MQDIVYMYEGEVVSKEEYIQKIGFAGYDDVFDKLLNEKDEKHNIEQLYLIQLFDYNCPSCVSGVTNVFVEDIEEFARIYQRVEEDKDRVNRFLISKEGEIVTDYYSDNPSLNIVQKVKVDDFGHSLYWGRDKILNVENAYGWASDYSFGLLIYETIWIGFNGKYYKLVKPHGKDCYKKSDFSYRNEWEEIEVYGNPFWIIDGTSLESYVWQVADIFDSEEAMNEDRKQLSKRCLSEQQINRVFADIPGDAG